MELTRAVVVAEAEAYGREEPFDAVERTNLASFPEVFRAGEFTWRDAMWVVRWYFRRFLGDYPDDRRREVESAFRENDYEALEAVFSTVFETEDAGERVRRLTALEGVSVPIASAYLGFLFPEAYVVVGEREWSVLSDAGRLDRPYPDPPSVEDYETYLAACRQLTGALDVEPWTLYRALWRLGAE